MATFMTVGQRIKYLRSKKGISQVELAKGICTPSMISQIESDRANPSHRVLLRLADRLETSLQYFLMDVQLNLSFMSKYKSAEVMMKAGEYDVAIQVLENILKTRKHDIERSIVQFDLAKCLFHTGQVSRARELFEQLRESFILTQERERIAETLHWLGILEYKEKRFQLALYNQEKAAEEFKQTEQIESVLKANTFYQIGLCYAAIGKMDDSALAFEQASGFFIENHDFIGLAKTYQSTAQAYTKVENYEKSVHFSEKAIAIYDSLELLVGNARMMIDAAVMQNKLGHHQKAEELLGKAFANLEKYGTKEDLGIANVEMAKIKFDQGQIVQAEKFCDTGMHQLPSMHVYQGWIKQIKGKIERERGKDDRAIRLFKTAADCFKKENQFSEWCSTMEELAQLYRKQQDFNKATEILIAIRSVTQATLRERGLAL